MKTQYRPLLVIFLLLMMMTTANAAKSEKKEIAPEFPDEIDWINERPGYQPDYEDKLTLLYFWDYTSVNCIREIRILQQLDQAYRPYGFEIIWVHSPEFKFTHDRNLVEVAVGKWEIKNPVALDHEFKIWDAFKTKSWPTKLMVRSDKSVGYRQVGEGEYVRLESLIRRELSAINQRAILPDRVIYEEFDRFDIEICGWMSGDTYMGYKRSSWWGSEIANKQWFKPDETVMFKDRGNRVERGFFAHGLWTNEADAFVHARTTEDLEDYIGLAYMAREVYVVAHQAEGKKGSRIYVTRDDEPIESFYRGRDIRVDDLGQTYFEIDDARLFYIIANENPLSHELKLYSAEKGDALSLISFANICLSEFEHI